MADLTERQARNTETSLMVGRLAGLARTSSLTADQRIGVSMAQKVLESRLVELVHQDAAEAAARSAAESEARRG